MRGNASAASGIGRAGFFSAIITRPSDIKMTEEEQGSVIGIIRNIFNK